MAKLFLNIVGGRDYKMIKMYTAFTDQIDDPDAAAKEICAQLQPEKNMLKNALGIAIFYNEYAESGVLGKISSALPFDVVGASSSFTGARGKSGEFALAVTMVTSDDVFFETGSIVSEGKKTEEIAGELKEIYGGFLAKGKPKLVLAYLAAHPHFSGDDLVDVTNEISEDIKLFGSLAWNTEALSAKNYVAFNESASPYIMSFAAFYGEFEPCFRIATALDHKALIQEAAEVTDAEGSVLKAVNGISALDYLVKVGVVEEGKGIEQMFAIPAIVIYKNGARVARAILESLPGGSKDVLAAGSIPIGSKISFSLLNGEHTISTTAETIKYFEGANVQSSLNYSCAARSWALGTQYFAELEIYADYCQSLYKSGKSANYILGYSAGEICPVIDQNGKSVNCLHNYSLISCILG
jgi:hypothetical protein